jgi:hypothetical protein
MKAMVDRGKWFVYSRLWEQPQTVATSRKPPKPPSEGEGQAFESPRVRQQILLFSPTGTALEDASQHKAAA